MTAPTRRIWSAIAWCALVAVAAATCAPPSEVVEHCEERCDCEDCKDEDHEECEIRYQARVDTAAAYDCEEEYLEYLDCITSKGTCVDDTGDEPFFGVECDVDGCPCEAEDEDLDDCIDKGSDADSDVIDV